MAKSNLMWIVTLLLLILNLSACQTKQNKKKEESSYSIEVEGINVLMADKATYPSTINMMISDEPGKEKVKRFWMQNWKNNSESFTWTVNVPEKGQYYVDILVSAPENTPFEIVGPLNTISIKADQEADRWGWYWDRIEPETLLSLPKGESTIELKLLTNLEKGASLKSIELVEKNTNLKITEKVEQYRSNTEWLGEAKFGVMVQWGGWGYPQHGEKKVWPEMINDFDVDAFVEKVASTKAGYVVWSATWRSFLFPAPIKAIDKVVEGRTCKRDLIGEIADALAKKNIKLIMYYHIGHETHPQFSDWWTANWKNWDDKSEFFRIWGEVVSEIGERYGDKLHGFLFDDNLIYYPAPYEKLAKIAKKGYKDRIVSFNDWIAPRQTEYQDFFFGEGFQWRNDLPVGGTGVFESGPYKGLHAHTMFRVERAPDWGIWKPETKIEGLNFSKEDAIKMALHAAERNYALSWNILMYEDGTIEEPTLELLREVGKAVRNKYPNTDTVNLK